MAEPEISQEMQQKIQTLQGLSQQLQGVAQQRQQMEMLKSETDRAKKALDEMADDVAVFRNIGAFMVQTDRQTAVGKLTEDQETLEVRLKRAKEQEKQMQEQFESLQDELQKALGQ